MRRLYLRFDHAQLEWKETLKEVEQVGRGFWEVREFQRISGVGLMAAHVFSATIEQPSRFLNKHKLWKSSQLEIAECTSDNKPLGYQRLDRRGNHELKISPIMSAVGRTRSVASVAHRLQIHNRPQRDQNFLSGESASDRKCPARAAQHSAQDFGDDVDDAAAKPVF